MKRFYQNLLFIFIGMTISSVFITKTPQWKYYLPIVISSLIMIFISDWAKIEKGPKPLKWWYHKILCEIGWSLRNFPLIRSIAWPMYYYHLDKCVENGFNLYGRKHA